LNDTHAAPSSAPRLYFLDWLRIAAFAVLLLYHVGMVYVGWDFHVKSPFAGPALEPWMRLSEPWRMSLLFIVSGAATAHLCKGGVSWRLLRTRSRHLLLPLLCGVVLVVPPQPYVEVVHKLGYSGSYFDFLRLYFSGYAGFCPNGRCIVLPTWNHLWFLPYLWLYSMLLFALLALWPQALVGLARLAHRALAGFLLLALPVVLIFLARLLLFKRFPSTHALLGDCFNHTIYLAMFITGATFASVPLVWSRLARLRWPALLLALALWAAWVGVRPGGLLGHAVVAALQWCALVAAIGWARQHLDVDHPWRARLTEAVFPVYILHQTFIIVLVWWLLPLRWPAFVEAPVLVLLTFVFSAAGYLFLRRITWLRPWFGMVKAQPSSTPEPRP
jgi:glucans biosynthesis protein C